MPKIQLLVRMMDGPPGSERYRGQIVSVKPVPNAGWGKGEGPPMYKIFEIDGIDFSDARVRLWERRHQIDVEAASGAGEHQIVTNVRSRAQFNFAGFSVASMNKVNAAERLVKLDLDEVKDHVADRTVEARRAKGRPDGN